MNKINRKIQSAVVAAALMLGCASSANAAITLVQTEDGWTVQLMGLISAFTGNSDFDNGESSTRVITGFNPSKLEAVVVAPEYNGMTVSAYFQLATSLNGAKTRRTGEQIEVRAADIAIAGSFGTINLGRSFAIHDSLPTINDTGSMKGVGYLCTGPDGAGPNCGHIGTGYSWPDWTAGVRYASPRAGGLQFRAGIFDPIETAFGIPGGDTPVQNTSDFSLFNFSALGNAIETSTPLFEAELNWSKAFSSGNLLAWTSFLTQEVEDFNSSNSTDIQAFSAGGRLTFNTANNSTLGITGNWTDTEGVAEGFLGFGVRCTSEVCDAADGNQWYINGDFTFSGKTTIGVSYGEGSEDANANLGNGNVERELAVVYLQHQLTPNFNLSLELQSFERSTDAGPAAGLFAPNEEYEAIMLGGEFRF